MTAIARRAAAWCGLALLCAGPAGASQPDALQRIAFDQASSRFGFELRTRWGATLGGHFPRHEGSLEYLADGRQRVRLRMLTRYVEIEGSKRYTELTRSARFFDAERYPTVNFVSEPYDESLLKNGGPLAGNLTIRGITRSKTLTVAPSACGRPAHDCDVVATGAVRRSDYGMDAWTLAVSDRVVFVLRARLAPGSRP
ncbi:MAG TPA: YceI family protein [Pseudoxanthomonas sp.]|nr:YceI family protein [Pseudoxanthomonas sp.]